MSSLKEIAMTLQLESTLMRATAADLHRAAEHLAEAREHADRRVDLLLDGGWSGASAESYRAAWEQWRAGSADVVAGLSMMGHLLESVLDDIVEHDAESRARLDSLAGQIVERLS